MGNANQQYAAAYGPRHHRSVPRSSDAGGGCAGAQCTTSLPRSVAMFGLSASVAFVGVLAIHRSVPVAAQMALGVDEEVRSWGFG